MIAQHAHRAQLRIVDRPAVMVRRRLRWSPLRAVVYIDTAVCGICLCWGLCVEAFQPRAALPWFAVAGGALVAIIAAGVAEGVWGQ